MPRGVDFTGLRFGRLLVLKRKVVNGRGYWVCKCDCGNDTIARTDRLKTGHTLSCGCLGREERQKSRTVHGCWGTRLYNIWHGMIQRCTNPNADNYNRYGGRGIHVCVEWRNSFEAFCEWAVDNGYSDNLSIDRIDNDGNYCPDNCRWATMEEQANNRRTSNTITFKGETHTLSDWAKITGIKRSTLTSRISNGWEIEKVLSKETNTRMRR